MSEALARVQAAIALGSNVGDRERTLATALRALERTPGVVILRRSRWIETEPVGGPAGQGLYLNGAVLVETTLAPRALLTRMQEIEQRAGRDRESEGLNGPRPLDLDLLFHGDTTCAEATLSLPHPRMEDRLFVLVPLAEVASEHFLPGCGQTVAERVSELQRSASPQ